MAATVAGMTIQSAEAARRDPAGVKTILVFGDSLSDGFGLARDLELEKDGGGEAAES